jgi:hypothetical protein
MERRSGMDAEIDQWKELPKERLEREDERKMHWVGERRRNI